MLAYTLSIRDAGLVPDSSAAKPSLFILAAGHSRPQQNRQPSIGCLLVDTTAHWRWGCQVCQAARLGMLQHQTLTRLVVASTCVASSMYLCAKARGCRLGRGL